MEVLTALDPDRIASLLHRDEFFWLDLTGPPDRDLEQLADMLRLEPRAAHVLRDPRGRRHARPDPGRPAHLLARRLHRTAAA
jgi:Mg2+ and Co2+ transporter CorA